MNLWNRTSLIAVLTLCVLTCTMEAQQQSAMQRAASAAGKRQWADVITITAPLSKSEPRNVQVLLIRAMAFVELAKFDAAIEACNRIIAIDRAIPQAWLVSAEALQRAGKTDSAIQVLALARTSFPDRSDVSYGLGLALSRAGRCAEAVDPLEEAAFRRPDDANVIVQLASCYRSIDRFVESAELYSRALDMRPRDAGIVVALGDVLMDLDNIDSAITTYSAAIRLDSTRRSAYLPLSSALTRQLRHRDAVNVLRAYAARYQDDAEGWYNLGTALQNVGRADSALRAFRTAIKLRANFAEAYFNMGIALDKEGFGEDAVMAFQRSALISSTLAPFAYNSMAIIHRMQGRFEEALEDHAQAIALVDSSAAMHASKASTLFSAKRYNEALEYLLIQRARFPRNADIAVGMGRCYVRLGRKDDVEKLIEELTDTRPAFAEELRDMMKN